MKTIWPKIGVIVSALALLHFTFVVVLTIPYAKREGAEDNFLIGGIGISVSILILIGCIVAWRRGSRISRK